MIAAWLCVYACGPSSVLDRSPGLDRATNDGGAGAKDAPFNLPGNNPMRPPPTMQPSGMVDPVGFSDGYSCKDDKECRSRHCTEGICCQSACDGTCQSCDQAGNLGKCLPVPEGQDPDDECEEEPLSSCGRDGACDGKGACRRYPSGMVCVAGSCTNDVEQAASLCDGNGACVRGAVKNCAPAMCLGDTCGPPCMKDTDCPAGLWCDAGTCRTQREPGMPCERAAQCGTGFCTDGVCCNMKCDSACYACDQPGSLGVCKAIADGQDPDNECPVQPIGTCGNNGGCNGRGACRKHPTGTFCGYGNCMNNTQYGNSICDGMGGCKRGPGRSCGAYACNGGLVCWTACANNAQCAPGHTCDVHFCD